MKSWILFCNADHLVEGSDYEISSEGDITMFSVTKEAPKPDHFALYELENGVFVKLTEMVCAESQPAHHPLKAKVLRVQIFRG